MTASKNVYYRAYKTDLYDFVIDLIVNVSNRKAVICMENSLARCLTG